MLLPNLLALFVDFWENCDRPSVIAKRPVDLVVPISYSILPNRLTKATDANLEWAIIWANNTIPIALSNCAYTFSGAATKEKELREELLQIRENKAEVIWAEDMNNSIQEARAIKEAVTKRGLKPQCILVVTCMMHTRSVRYIWKKTFPEAEILVHANDWIYEAEPDQPVIIQRSHWR